MKRTQLLLPAASVLAMTILLAAVALANGPQRAERLVDRTVHPMYTYGPELDSPLSELNESFEGTTFPPAGWIKISPDGGSGWNRQTNGTSPIPGWTGGRITVPTGGGNAVAFCTWNTGGASSNNQWLVTPRITNVQANDSLKFWVRYWPNNFADTLEVRISTNNPVVGDFTTLVATLGFPAAATTDTNWNQYRYRLANFVPVGSNIYIAFRERVADNLNNGASISLDLVQVTAPAQLVNPDRVCYAGPIPAYSSGVFGHASENLGDTLYVVGGASNGVPSTAVYTYSFTSRTWSNGVPLPTAKSGGDLVKCGPSLYYIGGGTTAITAGDAAQYKYTPGIGWEAIANIPTPVTGNNAECWGDSVIFCIAGGWSSYLTTVQVYRPGSNTWSTSTPIPAGRRTQAAGLWGDKIFVAAGFNGTFLRNFYIGTIGANANTITWTNGPDVPLRGTGSSRPGGHAVNGRFYFITGETSPAPGQQDSIYIWDIAGGAWLSQIITGRAGGTASNYWGVVSSTVVGSNVNIWIPGGGLTGATQWGLYALSANCLTVDVKPEVRIPTEYELSQNYPNPFNPSTTIKFSIPATTRLSLKVYNMLGQEVASLAEGEYNPGTHSVQWNAAGFASGVYFYRLQAGNVVETRKLILLK